MALSSTTTFDNFFTLGLSAYITEQMFDQVMTAHPLFAVLIGKDLPELKQYALTSDIPPEIKQAQTALWEKRGTRIEMGLEFGKNDTVQFMTPWQQLRSKQQQIVTRAIFDWSFIGGTVAVSTLEDVLSAGNEFIPGVTNAVIQTENLKKVMVDTLAQYAFSGSGTYPEMYGLQMIIPDVANVGTIGGHDKSTKPWWQTKQAAVSAELDSDRLINRMFLICSRGNSKDTPQIIITTQNVYEQVCEFAGDKQTFPQTKSAQMASLGFEHILFHGVGQHYKGLLLCEM